MCILLQLWGRGWADVDILSGDAKLSMLPWKNRGAAPQIRVRDVRLAGQLAVRRRVWRVADGEPVARAMDLAECEREPIHIPGVIQPHGVLLNLRESDLAITQVSTNAFSVL